MKNSYYIYFGASCLAISTAQVEGINRVVSLSDIHCVQDLCRLLSVHQNVSIISESPLKIYESVASHFKQVTAAGGIVCNAEGRKLMIYRNGRWDLPKGHLEQGETIQECAMREVEEETGVGGLTILRPLCITRHIYIMQGEWEIKSTHWYLMSSTHTADLTPQTEEGIDQVKWCSEEHIKEFLPSSYPTIQSVFRAL